MIICVCNNISDRIIKEMLPASLEEIQFETGCGLCCGSCLEALEALCNQHSQEQDSV